MELSQELLSLLLPSFIIDYFAFRRSHSDEDNLHLYFDENSDIPSEFSSRKVESKGFHNEICISDFPLRGRLVHLHIKRRRWRDIDTKESLQRNWNSIAKGTRMTEEFATFLKEINR